MIRSMRRVIFKKMGNTDNLDYFKVLGIEPTRDLKEIKRAYARLLPSYNPEKDPEGFQALRAAYEKALARINEEDTPPQALSPIEEFMLAFEQLYTDFAQRIQVSAWQKLLESDVCFQIDTGKEVSDRILSFMMDHYYFPTEVWQLFNQYFAWTSKREKLSGKFPKNFIDFVVNKILYKSYFRYHDLLNCKENRQEEFMTEYQKLVNALDEFNLYDAKKAIDVCRELCPEHPDFLVLLSRYQMLLGESDEAIRILTSMIEKDQENFYAYIWRGHHYDRIGKNWEAYADYQRANALLPNFDETLYSLGRCCLVLGKYTEAISYLGALSESVQNNRDAMILLYCARNFQVDKLLEMLKETPDDSDLKFKLAELYLDTGKVDEAYEILSELESNGRQSSELYVLLCGVLLFKGRKELAYTTCCKALGMFPEVPDLYTQKALLLDELGHYEESVEAYNVAISMNPDNATNYNNKAYSLNRLNRFNEALESADKAIELAPYMANSYKNKAEALLGLGLFEECFAACEEALNNNLYLVDAYVLKMELFARVQQYEEALIVCSKAEDLGIRNSKLLATKANILRLMGRLEEAKDLCDFIISQIDAENYDAYYYKGLCYHQEENFTEAMQCFATSLANNNKIEKANYYLLLSQMNSGDFDEALQKLNNILNTEINNKDRFHDLKGQILFERKKYKDCIAEYVKAIEINPDSADYYYRIAQANNELKKYGEAIKYFDLAIEKDPSELAVYIGKSFALYEMGKYKECAAECDLVLQTDPSILSAYQNKAWSLFMAGDVAGAESVCTEGLKINGSYLNLLELKLELYKRKEMVDEGLAVINRMLEIDPDNKNILNERELLLNYKKRKTSLLGRLLG